MACSIVKLLKICLTFYFLGMTGTQKDKQKSFQIRRCWCWVWGFGLCSDGSGAIRSR